MEKIYQNNIDNVYKDIIKSEKPIERHKSWKLYMNTIHKIEIKEFKDFFPEDKDFRKKRKKKFKNLVFKLYENQCLFCKDKTDMCILEAAHIHNHHESNNDDPYNGIILCVKCHKLFDKHVYKIIKENEKYKIRVCLEKNLKNELDNRELPELEKYPQVNRYLTYRYKN